MSLHWTAAPDLIPEFDGAERSVETFSTHQLARAMARAEIERQGRLIGIHEVFRGCFVLYRVPLDFLDYDAQPTLVLYPPRP
jgi:hypothetical protein